MLSTRRFPIRLALRFTMISFGFAALWAAIVCTVYALLGWEWLRVPFLPIATVGTAVAFYVGFKNNSSYDRFWEGRKIWGGIVNESRTFANFVLNHVGQRHPTPEVMEVRRILIYRHLAWINAVRLQLRRTSRFFDKPAKSTKERLERHEDHMRNDWDLELSPFLTPDELRELSARKNTATHILLLQGETLTALWKSQQLDLFHQIQLTNVVRELYALQGKAERIKHTPFPRQYAEYSRLFTRLFAFLLPFGMLDVFAGSMNAATGANSVLGAISMVLASGVVTWVFVSMEGIGDASEDPFERSMNDVPMNALCRTIEIDLREMLGETDLPEKEEAIEGILY